jgi:enamine deaminase RidA (YjgF/YER057c/UK114 family)
MRAQVDAVYRDLKETLAAHGATLRHVVKETVFTTDMERSRSTTPRASSGMSTTALRRRPRPGSVAPVWRFPA